MLIKTSAKGLKKAVDITVFGTLDNIVGGLAGILKWGFILSIVSWVLHSVGWDFESEYADDSIIFPYIRNIGPAIFGWLSEIMPFIQDLIDSMEKMPQSKDTYMTFLIESYK